MHTTKITILKVLSAPAIIYILAGTLWPLYHLIELCVFEKGSYVGLANFIRVFNDKLFFNSLQITAIFSITSVLIELLLGIILAVIVAHLKTFLQKILVILLVLDIMISPVGVALIWRFLLYPNIGLIDTLTRILFSLNVSWLGEPFWATITIIIVDVWHWTGFTFIIIFAGYISLPGVVFEAAQVDGASTLQQFFKITLPLLKPTIAVAALFRSIDILQAFPEIWQLTFGGPAYATTILNLLVYIQTFDAHDWSYAAVVSIVLVILSFTITFVYSILKQRWAT
ncbi:MAG: sugar ABC transporter permease [Nitrososphaeria archaeon]